MAPTDISQANIFPHVEYITKALELENTEKEGQEHLASF